MKGLWNSWGPLLVAIIIASGVVYVTVTTKWVSVLEHDLECDGSIGGGCDKPTSMDTTKVMMLPHNGVNNCASCHSTKERSL
tara:strand:+ start:444 stop:689 length:246 start_codon:yes stop_codon:yes gene_type:complete